MRWNVKTNEARARAESRERLTVGPGRKTAPGSKQQRYDRLRDLPGLVPLWPAELADFSPQGTRKILVKLKKAIRAERLRGQSGHWAYDLGRHVALVTAHKAERSRYIRSPAPGFLLRLNRPPQRRSGNQSDRS